MDVLRKIGDYKMRSPIGTKRESDRLRMSRCSRGDPAEHGQWHPVSETMQAVLHGVTSAEPAARDTAEHQIGDHVSTHQKR